MWSNTYLEGYIHKKSICGGFLDPINRILEPWVDNVIYMW